MLVSELVLGMGFRSAGWHICVLVQLDSVTLYLPESGYENFKHSVVRSQNKILRGLSIFYSG